MIENINIKSDLEAGSGEPVEVNQKKKIPK